MKENKFGDLEIKISGKPVGKITTFRIPVDKKYIKMFKFENFSEIIKSFSELLRRAKTIINIIKVKERK